MHLNQPQTIPHPSPWKNFLPRNRSLVPKRLGMTGWLLSSVSLAYVFVFMPAYVLITVSL